MLGKLIPVAQRAIVRSPKKTKKTPIGRIAMRIPRTKKKAKSHNPSSANQPQIQDSKKCHGSWQGGRSAIRVNATVVAKKDKDKNKTKDLSHVKCYICKPKDYYVNECPEK